MAATYRFKTVMVTDSDRFDFSTLRDSFGVKVSDRRKRRRLRKQSRVVRNRRAVRKGRPSLVLGTLI
jgi:hypothetical protein